MSVETTAVSRIAQSESLSGDALANATDFTSTFLDLSSVNAPITVLGPITYAPTTTVPQDFPDQPDSTRPDKAVSALADIDGEAQDFDQEVDPRITSALQACQAEIQAVSNKIAVLSGYADAVVIPSANDFAYAEGDFNTGNDIDAELKAIITSEIAKGGEGFSDTVEDAQYTFDQDRRDIAREEAVDDALIAQCGRSLGGLPQGFHVKAVDRINSEYRQADRTRSRDIMIGQTKLSAENKWRAVNSGIDYNQIKISLADTQASRALDAATKIFSLTLDALKFRVQAAAKQTGLGKTAASAIADGKQSDIDAYTATLARVGRAVDGLLAKARGYIGVFRADGQIFASELETAIRETRLSQSKAGMDTEQQFATIEIGMSAARNALQSSVESARIQLKANSGLAQIQAKNAKGAIQALDTVIQLFKSGDTAYNE